MDKSSLMTVIAGTGTLVVAIALQIVPGKAPAPATMPNEPGFKTAMLWLELADSAEEVFANLGDSSQPEGQLRRRTLDTANKIDFLFLAFYSTFHACLFLLLLRSNDGGRLDALMLAGGLCLALCMFTGDILENIQMLQLTGYQYLEDIPDSIVAKLEFWTRVKWGAIFVAALLLSTVYFRRFGPSVALLIGVPYLAAGTLGLIGIFYFPARNLIEVSTLPIAIAWGGSLVHAVLRLRNESAPRRTAA
jgi:hypothetical protein